MTKKLAFFILGVFIILVFFIYILETSNSVDNYDELISLKKEDINEGIKSLNYNDESDEFYETIVLLTEIKQDSMMVINLISWKEANNKEIAVGDLLGYMYYYIDDIEFGNISRDMLMEIINELEEVGEVFERVNRSRFDNYNDYINVLWDEVNRNVEKYPNNTILKRYSNRRIPQNYKVH